MPSDGEAASQELRERLPRSGAALEALRNRGDERGCFRVSALKKSELVHVTKTFSASNLSLSRTGAFSNCFHVWKGKNSFPKSPPGLQR